MSTLDEVRAKFNEKSVEWLKNCLTELNWTPRELAKHIDANNIYLYKTINRILEGEVKTPQLNTLHNIADVLRKEEQITHEQMPISEEKLAKYWLFYTITGNKIIKIVPIQNKRKTLWILGSYTGLSEKEKKIAENIVNTLPSMLISAGIRVVVGDSTMLREFIYNCRDAHNQTKDMVPNPIMIFGRLRKRDLRALFEDTINNVPDLALLIGGNVERGRVKEEYECSVEAGIPIICIPATGGVAKQVKTVAEKARHLFNILNETGKDVDAGDLITAIWEAIRAHIRHQ